MTNQEIRAYNAKRFAEERKRDAELLAAYQRECEASWKNVEH